MDGISPEARVQYAEFMKKFDELNPSPSERAEVLYKHMQTMKPKPTIWDMVCFAGELLTVACEDLPSLQPHVKQIISSIYTAHYNVNEPFASSVRSGAQPQHSSGENVGSGEPTPISSRPPLTLIKPGVEESAKSSTDNGTGN